MWHCNLPNANPSFAHCTLPPKFPISHRNSASVPSSTWRFCGCTRKYCLTPLPATYLKAASDMEREKWKFKLELIKYNYCRRRWEVMIFFSSTISCHTHYYYFTSHNSRHPSSRWLFKSERKRESERG